jgi:hypothetical protein
MELALSPKMAEFFGDIGDMEADVANVQSSWTPYCA